MSIVKTKSELDESIKVAATATSDIRFLLSLCASGLWMLPLGFSSVNLRIFALP
jgi:hypothetical protein